MSTVIDDTSTRTSPEPPAAPSTRVLLRWLLGITRPVHPPLLVSLCCRIVNLLLDLALFATAAAGVVSLATDGGTTCKFLALLVVLSLAKATTYYFEQFTGHYVAFKSLELLRTHVFAALWPKAPAVVTQSRSGDVLTSLTRDVDRIEVVYAHTFAPVVSAYVVAPVAVITAGVWVGWGPVWMAAVCLAISLLVVPYVGMRSGFAGTARTLELRRELTHQVSDTVFGMDEVLGYGRGAERAAEMDDLGAKIADSARLPRRFEALRRGANVALSLLAVTSVVWAGAGTYSPIALAALAAGTLRIFEGPRGVEDATGYLDHSFAAVRRLWDISHAPERVHDGPAALTLAAAPNVTFDAVSYAYPSRDDVSLEDAVSGIDLTAPAGGHTAIVGRSGSGKSTLAQLLVRYDDPHTGRILLDGQPVDSYTLDSLRHGVVMVSQHSQLLAVSIAENLRLGAPDATEGQLWRALDQVGLGDEVRAMPHGLATHVGTAGNALSGGQIQRLCLARALLMQPRVLVLDEFTANLNVALENEIRERLAQLRGEVTIVEITHRLQALEQADLVVVVDSGHIVAQGTFGDVADYVTN